jgi:hypothetical protein
MTPPRLGSRRFSPFQVDLMYLSWINIMADAAILLAGGLAGLYCCLGARPDRAAQVRWEDLVRRYPDLDRELDMIWLRYER